jgi:NAD(P)-dependent dehydrogenase (short-subunit alcohol dehydrogenase family)
MSQLNGKVSIITGAASGIGLQTAMLFAKEGAKVFIGDFNEAGASETIRMIKNTGGEADFVTTDVSKSADVKNLVDKTIARYGKLDVIFNNAGIEGKIASIVDTSEVEWDRILIVNLRGVFLGMKYAIPAMIKNGGGSIISTASIAALVGIENIPAYSASKGGIIALTRVAAVETFKYNIRVNCICPGFIDTPMVDRFVGGNAETKASYSAAQPRGHFGKTENIAQVALFLASDASSFVNGQALVADDGYTAR